VIVFALPELAAFAALAEFVSVSVHAPDSVLRRIGMPMPTMLSSLPASRSAFCNGIVRVVLVRPLKKMLRIDAGAIVAAVADKKGGV
jgi:hypothetical protein